MSYSETITKTDLTNILNKVLPSGTMKVMRFKKNHSFSGQSYVDIQLTGLPSDAHIEAVVITRMPNPNWVFCGIPILTEDISSSVRVAYNNTYSSAITSDIEIAVIYSVVSTSSLPSFVADYIVEQGTSGIWTYRKWNSGVAECWGRTSISGLTTSVNLPFTFADSFYETQVTLINNSNTATNVTAISSYTDRVSVGVNTVPSGGARLYVIGKWK